MEVFIRAIPFLLLFSGFNFTLNAQSEWKGWASANLTLSFTKKLDLRFSHLRSYTLSSPMENGFNQTSASLNYDLTKRLNILGGYMLTTYPSGSESTNRGFTRVSYKIPLAKVISWSNAIQAEYFSASETRYRSRLIYTTRFANRKEIPFLHLTLSATYWLYYNIGGNEIRYFDKTGTVLMRHSPDGLHRRDYFLL